MCTVVTLSGLAQHRVLAPGAGLYVSPLQLGNATDWGCQDGKADTINKEAAFALLDTFHEAGGNFIDTAHNTEGGLSEEWIGEWAEQRHIRDQLVIATKYSTNSKRQTYDFSGNNVKSIVLSLEASLKNLRTSYVDVLYVDSWEWSAPVMNALHSLVAAGKVLYLGLSNSPAWICSKANMYARAHGKTPFLMYRGSWNIMDRTFVRDIVPMARVEGMAIALSVATPTERPGDAEGEPCRDFGKRNPPAWEKNSIETRIHRVLEKVAKEVGVECISAVAVAYILHKVPHVFPVIRGPNIEQLFATIKGLEIRLSSEQASCIESAIAYGLAHLPNGNGVAAGVQSPSDANGLIATAAALKSTTPVPVDARAIAHTWLKEFAEITASGDARNFATKLFKHNGWFRDILVFTWDNRTLRGHGKIAEYLEENLASAKITNVTLDETPALCPSPFTLPLGKGIEFSFRFETPIAFGRGSARLLPTNFAETKALSVFVMMEDLKGHEESGAESGIYGGHTITWNEVFEERRSKVENDPQVLIIGGGQCGLHVAARFKQMDISALVVEKSGRIGDSWRKRYPSLTLHTPKYYSTTLYQSFPSNFPLYIPRDKVADWLEHYAKTQDLVVWTNSQVLPKAAYDSQEKRWTIQIDRDGTKVIVCPKHVVVATGLHGFPHIPGIPCMENFRGQVLHTSQFPGGQKFAGLRVVVVGAGNSSADICQELSFRGAASVTMVQRSKTCVISARESTKSLSRVYPDDRPVEISDFKRAATPIAMARVIARANADQAIAADKEMLEGLRKAGFQHSFGEDRSGPEIVYFSRGGGHWLDVGCAKLIASGKVTVRQGVEPVSFTESGIVFNDGFELQADAVIFATGYTSWKDCIKDIFDPEVIESTKEIWGLDEEDEICGAYRPTGYPALWYAAGNFADSRFRSKQLALHIKAEELGLKDD